MVRSTNRWCASCSPASSRRSAGGCPRWPDHPLGSADKFFPLGDQQSLTSPQCRRKDEIFVLYFSSGGGKQKRVRVPRVGIYLPIAEMSANVFVLLAMGAAVGFLSGMFGVGGGFLITPLLIFYNIPPAIAVATGANQVIASSFSGSLAHFKRGTLDFKLGTVLLAGGIFGSSFGTLVFAFLRRIGQLDLVISLIYVIFLGTIGGMMLVESVRAIRRTRSGVPPSLKKSGQHNWIHRLPLKMRFRTSKLFVSVLPVLGLGAAIGFLAAIMGVGGGIIMVPALIYLLKVPTNVVVGTSLFQIIFVAAFTTIVQSTANQTVDMVLALTLMLGGVAGAQYGARAGQKLRGEQLRALLAILVLAVALRLAFDLFSTPASRYSMTGLEFL